MPNTDERRAKKLVMDGIAPDREQYPALSELLLKEFENDWREFLREGHKETTPANIVGEFMVWIRKKRFEES